MSAAAQNNAKPGDFAIVQDSTPPGTYPLRNGLRAGDLVKLLSFDHGYWNVRRESDGLETVIYTVNIDRIAT